ncbi:MAG TPA: CopD family protein [Steroidobacteraceae bacterium]|nr:CopD family protein [Steroidobacteraceae bacterium]
MSLALTLHILAAIIWIGGMFFAHVALRPSAGALEVPMRLALWERVLGRFFMWVWLSIAALLLSGFVMVFIGFGGFALLPPNISLMMAVGVLMAAIFAYIYFVHWPRLRRGVAAADWAAAEHSIKRIRRLVGLNLLLGIATVVLAAAGAYFS